ncbi:hypothetical protein MTBBW1_790024 [Desulfamplus magnetovallimortis]|uniref:Uncharacterized protein n=1 Tax=Desulfamplus magnetovallimortis TaxID=1246637 RepID=A0A1W1HJL5_9BACT|nr:hypothetical protein MTBBW1_790024 [Desulfamplus magnetovallimortis]
MYDLQSPEEVISQRYLHPNHPNAIFILKVDIYDLVSLVNTV